MTLIPAARLSAASAVLFLVIFFPLIVTTSGASAQVNQAASSLQFAFVALLVPETAREIKFFWSKNPILKFFACCFLICILGWLLLLIPFTERPRSAAYVAHLLFAFAAIAWFRRLKDIGLGLVIFFKLLSVAVALVIITHYLLALPDLSSKIRILTDPPIYRNIRHLNYDLAMIFALSFLFSIERNWIKYEASFQAFIFTTLGFFSVWSAGRGQFLSMSIFIVLLVSFRILRAGDIRLIRPLLMFSIGGALVFLTGNDYFIDAIIVRASEFRSLDELSSNRIAIWQKSLRLIRESWMVGFGPDAFIYSGISSGLVHAHNFILQWLLEFGVIGTAGLMSVVWGILLLCFKTICKANGFTCDAVVATLLISTFVFALVDGHFYHAIPLTMIILLCGYLVSSSTDSSRTDASCP